MAENLFGLSRRVCESIKNGDYEEFENEEDGSFGKNSLEVLFSEEMSSSSEMFNNSGVINDENDTIVADGLTANETEFY